MKGQWFIISAVVITSFFVVLSGFLKDYYAVDLLPAARFSEPFYFENVKALLKKSVANSPPNCDGIEKNLTEAIHYTTRKMAALGYIEEVTFTRDDCLAKRYLIELSISSEHAKKSETFRT